MKTSLPTVLLQAKVFMKTGKRKHKPNKDTIPKNNQEIQLTSLTIPLVIPLPIPLVSHAKFLLESNNRVTQHTLTNDKIIYNFVYNHLSEFHGMIEFCDAISTFIDTHKTTTSSQSLNLKPWGKNDIGLDYCSGKLSISYSKTLYYINVQASQDEALNIMSSLTVDLLAMYKYFDNEE